MWSKELQEKTKDFLSEQGGGFMKSDGGKYGIGSLKGDGSCTVSIISGIMPKPTGEELQFASVEELLAAGWVVD